MTTHYMKQGTHVCKADARHDQGTTAIPVVSCQRCLAWLEGHEDGRSGTVFGMTYDGDTESPRSVAYDDGRTAGEQKRRKGRA